MKQITKCVAGYNILYIFDNGDIRRCPCFQLDKNKDIDGGKSLGNIYQNFKSLDSIYSCEPSKLNDGHLCEYKSVNETLFNLDVEELFFQWHITESCNFRCEYCFVFEDTLNESWKLKSLPAGDVHKIGKVIDNILNFKKTRNKKSYVTVTFIGGEPFEKGEMTYLCKELTKQKIRVGFNTNLTLDYLEFFLKEIDPTYLGWMSISLHPDQLSKRKLKERFIKNIRLLEKFKIHYQITVVAYPPLLNGDDDWITYFNKRHIYFQYIDFEGGFPTSKAFARKYNIDPDSVKYYPEAYLKEENDMIENINIIQKNKLSKFEKNRFFYLAIDSLSQFLIKIWKDLMVLYDFP